MKHHKYGERSLARLDTVKPALRAVCIKGLELAPVDLTVLEGARSIERQHELYAKGRMTSELRAKGILDIDGQPLERQVTWTLNSKHIPRKDGFSWAVDLAPYPIDWKNTARFDQMAAAMFRAASILGVTIRWGADWDSDGVLREKGEHDSPHFELVNPNN